MAYPNEPQNPYAQPTPRSPLDYRRPTASGSGAAGLAIGALVVLLLIVTMVLGGSGEEPATQAPAPAVAPAGDAPAAAVPAAPAGEPEAPAN